ncbi:phosphotriesterase [Streptomyces cocklensis]|uniref:Phosphotriesterase-related protein n=1 Tax=Actinacidiphila cocklensis TaxID=887465 RepID=A0A9W4E3F7_9ACTN|nr:phosphotriesterase [Actinacidiphila cocklensis]MDD1063871.1 phosphotriesterase [Actinacidiphila cocklensis]CAG6392570.1 Phosphotriesterase-related protein [Actinacidiphila cocklensis]
MTAVRTVLGDIEPAALGVCDAHDHLFLTSPAMPGPQLDDPAEATERVAGFRALGGEALAQWTPFGMGRRPAEAVAVSRATGVHVIAATGLHQAVHYDAEVLGRLRRGDGLAAFFTAELTEGMIAGDGPGGARTAARAGMIKVAGMFHGLDDHTRWVMAAAAQAHHATGAPIGVHHEMGTAAVDVLGLLHGELGVPARSVLLGHLNRFPDAGVHRELAAAGAYLAFDGPSRAHHATDAWLVDSLVALAAAGHTDQLLLGADTTSPGGGPGAGYLLRTLRPRLIHELGSAAAESVFRANPAGALAAPWPVVS